MPRPSTPSAKAGLQPPRPRSPVPTRPWLLVGALAAIVAAAGTSAPAAAEVTVSSQASPIFADVATQGQFDSDRPPDVVDQPNVDVSAHAELEGGRADASVRATVNASATGASATASGTTDIEHCCTEDEDGNPVSQTGAGAGNGFSVNICSDQRATFSASLSGNVQANGDASTNVFASLCCDANGETIDAEGEDSSLGPTMNASLSGVLNDDTKESSSCVSIGIGASSSLDTGQPTSVTQWSLSVSVVETPEPPDADEFVWIGGSSGAFTDPDNWSPAGGPPDASDTALFTQGGLAAVDLASETARSPGGAPRGPVPIERLLERTRVNLDPLQPNAGVLRLLSPSLEEPSLVVNSGGRLLVDNGSVAAQSAVVGEDGLGTVEVTGPNLFQTDGILVLGKDGEGRLNVFGGGNALTNEVVMGEGSQPGNAFVLGNGSLWIASKLHVSKNEPSTVQVFAGAELDTTEAVVDLAPQGELPNVTVDQSGKWLVDRLEIRGRGVVECTGGRIEPRDPNATGEIVVGSFPPGTARLLVSNGGRLETTGDLVVGRLGDGQLTVDSSNLQTNAIVGGTFRAGVGSLDLGNVTLLSSITSQTDNLVAGGLEYLAGDFSIGHAARVRVSGEATIGRPPATLLRSANVSLLGNGPPSLTELRLAGPTRIRASGTVDIRDATLFVGSTFDIDEGGTVRGSGSDNVLDALNGILNNGRLQGRLRLPPGTNILSQSTGTVEVVQSGAGSAPQLSPLGASAFARALRRPAPPPLPPDGLLEFEGDGEIAGSLVLQFRNGFAPRSGDAIELVKAGGALTGSFASVEIRGLAPGAQFDTSAAGGALTMVALNDAVALPTVSMTAKAKLKEKKKAGAKVKLVRDGDLSAPLLVSYALGGTARNGIDYELLPGTIEIPARKRTAKIAIRPRRDALVEGPETIELTLLPGPDYTPSAFSEVTIALTSADRIPEPKKKRRR